MKAFTAIRGLMYPIEAETFEKAIGKIMSEEGLGLSQMFALARADRNTPYTVNRTGTIASRSLYKLCNTYHKEPEYFGADINRPYSSHTGRPVWTPESNENKPKAEQTVMPIEKASDNTGELLEAIKNLTVAVENVSLEIRALKQSNAGCFHALHMEVSNLRDTLKARPVIEPAVLKKIIEEGTNHDHTDDVMRGIKCAKETITDATFIGVKKALFRKEEEKNRK